MMEHIIPTAQIAKYQSWQDAFQTCHLPHQVLVNMHGIPVALQVATPTLQKALTDYFPHSWQVKVGRPQVRVFWSGPERMTGKPETWDDVVNPSCLIEQSYVYQRDFCAHLVSAQEVRLVAEEKISDGFFNFLRYFLPQRLLKLNKILLHSSCLVDSDNQAYLFLGHSGAGKTTVARQAAVHQVLGDDMNLLSLVGEQVVVESALVGQCIGNAQHFGHQYPVKAAFWLHQAPAFALLPIKHLKLNHFMASFSGLFWDQLDQQEYKQVFNIIAQLDEMLPLYDLEFNLENEVWDAVRKFTTHLSA